MKLLFCLLYFFELQFSKLLNYCHSNLNSNLTSFGTNSVQNPLFFVHDNFTGTLNENVINNIKESHMLTY